MKDDDVDVEAVREVACWCCFRVAFFLSGVCLPALSFFLSSDALERTLVALHGPMGGPVARKLDRGIRGRWSLS